MLLLLSIIVIAVEKNKPEKNPIKDKDQTKLKDSYGKKFNKVTKFNSYRTYGNIAIINVSLGEDYARIITKTQKLEEVLK